LIIKSRAFLVQNAQGLIAFYVEKMGYEKKFEQITSRPVSYTGDWDRVEEPDFLVVF
jgi:hypothetical protein